MMFSIEHLRTVLPICIDPQSWRDEESKIMFKLHIPEIKS